MAGIKGFIETSFVDWPGKVCAVLFLGGCNFRCPFCHNHSLVLSPDLLTDMDTAIICQRLAELKKWLGGVCISGGEPCLDPGLPALIRRIKELGYPVKLDTNGSRPEILSQLVSQGALDMISMDVKAPLEQQKYNDCAGVKVDLEAIKESIAIIKRSKIEHEFRITILPLLHSEKDVLHWANFLEKTSLRTIQNFNPQKTLNPEFTKMKGYSPEVITRFNEMIQ